MGGGAFGGGGGGGGSKQTTIPPKFLAPGFREAAERARRQSRRRDGFFPKPTVEGFNRDDIRELDLRRQRALNGNPLLDQSQDYTSSVLAGDFLPGGEKFDPFFDRVQEAQANRIIPQVLSAFGGAGRVNSGLALGELTRQLGDSNALAFSDAFQQERNRQQGASQFAPQLAREDYFDIDQIGSVGDQIRRQRQLERNADRERFEFNRDEGRNRLNEFIDRLNALRGSSGVTKISGGGGGGGGQEIGSLLALAGAFGGGGPV